MKGSTSRKRKAKKESMKPTQQKSKYYDGLSKETVTVNEEPVCSKSEEEMFDEQFLHCTSPGSKDNVHATGSALKSFLKQSNQRTIEQERKETLLEVEKEIDYQKGLTALNTDTKTYRKASHKIEAFETIKLLLTKT